MIYDLYLLSEFFPREQAIINFSQAIKYCGGENLALAISAGLVSLSRSPCGRSEDEPFFFLTGKGREFIERGGELGHFI